METTYYKGGLVIPTVTPCMTHQGDLTHPALLGG